MVERAFEKAASIVSAAGGKVVGRTRLQKLAYLFEITGIGDGFDFEYRHYGPYSEELTSATYLAEAFDLIDEQVQEAQWGGKYSIFNANFQDNENRHPARVALGQLAANADSIELELAATAAFLARDGEGDPWAEVARRKPEKADANRLERARQLYRRLSEIETPVRLPNIE